MPAVPYGLTTEMAEKIRIVHVRMSTASMAIFTSYDLDFLSQIFGRPAHHQSRDEHGEHDKNENAVKPRADTAKYDFAEHDVNQRNHPALAACTNRA